MSGVLWCDAVIGQIDCLQDVFCRSCRNCASVVAAVHLCSRRPDWQLPAWHVGKEGKYLAVNSSRPFAYVDRVHSKAVAHSSRLQQLHDYDIILPSWWFGLLTILPLRRHAKGSSWEVAIILPGTKHIGNSYTMSCWCPRSHVRSRSFQRCCGTTVLEMNLSDVGQHRTLIFGRYVFPPVHVRDIPDVWGPVVPHIRPNRPAWWPVDLLHRLCIVFHGPRQLTKPAWDLSTSLTHHQPLCKDVIGRECQSPVDWYKNLPFNSSSLAGLMLVYSIKPISTLCRKVCTV